jgi:hypothetical protein
MLMPVLEVINMSVLMTDRVSIRGPAHFFQNDTRTQIVWFTVNRYNDGVDLAQLAWSIHFRNADGLEDVSAPFETPDVRGGKIIVGWLVKGSATDAVGDLTFNLRGVGTDNDGNPLRWSGGDEKRPVYAAQESAPGGEQVEAITELDALIMYVAKELPKVIEAKNAAEAAAEAAYKAVENVNEAVDEAIEQAKADGEFKGEPGADGFSPTVNISKVDKLTTIKITTAQGDVYARIADGQDGAAGSSGEAGKDGEAGFSPEVSVATITGGHRVTITDAYGDKSFDVMDGKDGTSGEGGGSGEDGATFYPNVSGDGTLSWTNDKGLSNPSPVNIKGKNGDPGAPGQPGADGNGVASIDMVSIDSEEDEEGGNSQSDYYVPSVSTDGTLSWIASSDNMPAVPPVNIKGPRGNSGRTPVKGVDYYTDAEKADLVAEVLAALPVYEGEVADA